jgi:tetratricopeptide (TPR) repeat protein/TolB-like protein/tRNA A-37 threonylcarbamoyl transferase component Bud32
MLHRALGYETETTDTLEEVLDEIHVPDADWRIGNYQILEEIGRGGMGVIYRARQRHSKRIVALKRILSYQAESQETLVRFRREAEAAASLDHPNILPIYEVSESDDGLPFFSMKFAAGGSLLDAARSLRKDPRRIIALMAKVTRAVQYAHLQGILHRDLKPGNILLDGRGEPLVSDFGLAKWLDTSSDLTRTLTIFGTPGYIAPEQAHGAAKSLTPAADIYSIGAVLFDLFTGRPPFLGEHALAVIKQASDKPAPKLRTLAPLADRDVETICAKCLEREPQARYRSADDLAQDLERWLEGRPIVARPVSPPVRIWRWSKRNPKLAASIAACLVLGTAAAVWQIQTRHLTATVREEQVAAHSIAVLPFLDLDTARAAESFLPELSRSLSKDMAKLGPSRVISLEGQTECAGAGNQNDIKNSAEASHCRAVLTGTTRSFKGKVRMSVRLMDSARGDVLFHHIFEIAPDAATGREMWKLLSNSFYTILNSEDPATLNTEVDSGLRNANTRELILAGQEFQNRETIADFDRAIERFEKAVAQEPASALAWASLALAYANRAGVKPDPRLLEKAELAARSALKLNPEIGEAHRALAGVIFQRGHYEEALEEALLAIEFAGFDPRPAGLIGNILKVRGDPIRALAWFAIQKHGQLNPADGEALLADCLTTIGEDTDAEKVYQRAAEFHPERPQGWIGICHLHLLNGDIAGARRTYESNLESHRDSTLARQMAAEVEFFGRNYEKAEALYSELIVTEPDGGGLFYGRISYKSALAWIRFTVNPEDGRTRLKTCLADEETTQKSAPRDPDTLYRLAALQASLGNNDASLVHLNEAFQNGWLDYRSLALDPRFDGLRQHEGYTKFVNVVSTRVDALRRSQLPRQAMNNSVK